jgi:hypothetical protein
MLKEHFSLSFREMFKGEMRNAYTIFCDTTEMNDTILEG